MKPKIIVVGSANTDFVVRVPQLPAQGETVLGGDFKIAKGGKGANQAVAAARLGGEVTLVARLGDDHLGRDALSAYQHEGIDTRFLVLDRDAPSGVALIMVNPKGENLIAVAPGANDRLSPKDVLAAEKAFMGAGYLLVQLEIPLETVQAAAELAHRYTVRVILNPAPARPLPIEILRWVDILTPNETEAAILAGEAPSTKNQDHLSYLFARIGVPNLVVTLGSAGAYILNQAQKSLVPSFSITPVDTTASGDAFNGALALALAQGHDLSQAVRYANAAGALTATHAGAQPSLPSAVELEQFIASARNGSHTEMKPEKAGLQ
jgi:ribokinase